MRDEIERVRERMRLVGRMRPRQLEAIGCQYEHGDERQQRQQCEGRTEAAVIDAEADDQRPRNRGGRIAERQQAEIANARARSAHLARRILRGDLERHE